MRGKIRQCVICLLVLTACFMLVLHSPAGTMRIIGLVLAFISGVGGAVFICQIFFSKRREVIDQRTQNALHRAGYYAFCGMCLVMLLGGFIMETFVSTPNNLLEPNMFVSIAMIGLAIYFVVFLVLDFRGK